MLMMIVVVISLQKYTLLLNVTSLQGKFFGFALK